MRIAADAADAARMLEKILRAGGVAIAPCDTIYGFIGIAPDTDARIRRIKGRGETKPFLQLIADSSWVAKISDLPIPPALGRHWPGPLTMIFPDRAGGTVAVRVPDSPFLHGLLESLQRPLYSTSVNRAGNPPMRSIDEMSREFEAEVDIVVDAGDLPPSAASTIVDVTAHPCRVVRAGALAIAPEELL